MLAIVSTYGVSPAAARFHLANCTDVPLELIAVPKTSRAAQAKWHAAESALSCVYSAGTAGLPQLRRGRFAELVLQAAKNGLVSQDTAAAWLRTNVSSPT